MPGRVLIVSCLKSGREAVAFRQPHVGLVGEGAVVGQRLVDQVRAVLVVGADAVGVPQVEIDPAAVAAAGPDQGHGLFARHVGGFGDGGSPAQGASVVSAPAATPAFMRSRRPCGDKVAPPLRRAGGFAGHGGVLSRSPRVRPAVAAFGRWLQSYKGLPPSQRGLPRPCPAVQAPGKALAIPIMQPGCATMTGSRFHCPRAGCLPVSPGKVS